MDGQARLRAASCIPCSKRKVRCDRLEPCSHCKRRTKDVCEYPLPNSRSRNVRQYLRADGTSDDLHHAAPAISGGRTSSTPSLALITVSTSPPRSTQGTKRDCNGTPRTDDTSNSHPQAGLVEHNKHTTYIEAPVWYSWTEARKPGNEAHESQEARSRTQQQQNDSSTGYYSTLLDPPSTVGDHASYCHHPSATEAHVLWKTFLANVHPVVKIFFDWDIEPVVHKAASDSASLSQGQRALCFAIYFIATRSLSDVECKAMLDCSTKRSVLHDYQSSVEYALRAANYASTGDLLVLQALILYLLAMRNRAKPATSFSLMGVAVRIAQRLGLHRDGSNFGLSPVRAEERRRIWWQMQHMEISISQLIGCISMTLYTEWDTKLPANLEDNDIHLEIERLPIDRPALTSMSHCLWRYYVLHLHRAQRNTAQGAVWITSGQPSLAEQDSIMERYRGPLAEKFLQHCEPVNPLHVHIQIGIQCFLLAWKRGARQPGFANARISEMPQSDRDELLRICTKSMDYYILAETTPSIAHLRWHSENYFQWTALVYILIEAHHRAATAEASALWSLVNRVCELHPKLTTAVGRAEVYAIARLVVLAWQQRQRCLREQQAACEKPWCVGELERALNVSPSAVLEGNERDLSVGMDGVGRLEFDLDFDFDLVDWSFWETGRFASA